MSWHRATIFGLFAGVYYWYPKATGRMMSEFWGKVHFFGSLLFMNLVFIAQCSSRACPGWAVVCMTVARLMRAPGTWWDCRRA